MKELKLINSDLKALVDDEDYERLLVYRWYLSGQYKNRVSRNYISGYKCCNITLANEVNKDYNRYSMYDHKDRNFLNNQKLNLRTCSFSENNVNNKKRDDCSSQYKNVSFEKGRNKWRVTLKKNRKKYSFGSYTSEIEAAKVADEKMKEFWGEFAVLNFPVNKSI